MKIYTHEELVTRDIGPRGTKKREQFEHKVNMAVIGYFIKKAREEQKMTQEQLGKLIGVQKARVSKLERGANSATLDTIIKVFNALKADFLFTVKIGGKELKIE